MKIYQNNHDAYLGTLADVYDNPECVSSPRGQPVREKFNYQFTILNPTMDYVITKDLERNKVIEDYSKKEFDLYESGSNLAEDFGKASKFWLKLQNPDKTVNSAYGYLVFKKKSMGNQFEMVMRPHPGYSKKVFCETEDQVLEKNDLGTVLVAEPIFRTPVEWAEMCLREDKDTRQAVVKFSLPEHFWKGNKDFTCTLHGIFMIRNDKLNFTVNMRSNDMTLGLVYDLPWFISLMYRMKDRLKDVYPDLQIGTYTHYVHNIHVYDRDEDKINKMLGR